MDVRRVQLSSEKQVFQEVWRNGDEEESFESSDDPSEEEIAIVMRKRILRCCLCASLCSCCTLATILVGFLAFQGASLVVLRTQNMINPHLTPVQFPRYSSCGGCAEGNKTDAELAECIHPCFNLSFILEWERFAAENGYKLVYFPSRPGPKDEAPVNISAWWLPAPDRAGRPAPRVVAFHGMSSNNNHCGVQSTCYLLRSIGFSCLALSARDCGLSGASTHPTVGSWGYDYHLDALGAWDYAVGDPEGLLGGSLPPAQVGIMGFSKGALESAIAFGLEPRIPGAWLDSGPFGGLFGMTHDVVSGIFGPVLGDPFARIVFAFSILASGHRVDNYDPLALMSNCTVGSRRQVMIAHSSLDQTVPVAYAGEAVKVLSGLPGCYEVSSFTPPEFCNGETHHQEMWEFPDDTRSKLCHFWSRTFARDPADCRLDSLPKFQTWSPPGNLPPGSPSAPPLDS